MPVSLKKTLSYAAPYLDPNLVSQVALSAIETVAGVLPDSHSISFGFEIRLWDKTSDADFCFKIPGPHPAETLSQLLNGPNASAAIRDNPVWKHLESFGARWSATESLFRTVEQDLWLEFDSDQCRSKTPIPGAFFRIRDLLRHGEDGWRAILEGTSALIGSPISPELARRLSLCLRGLPETAYGDHIGMMFSRPGDLVKVSGAGFDDTGALDYLSRIGWDGAAERLGSFLAETTPMVDWLAITMELGPDVRKRIGIEYHQSWEKRFLSNTPWRTILEYLVERGMCLPAKRDALVAWPGTSRHRFDREQWESLILRTIDHIKITCSPEGEIEAKAYIVVVKHPWIMMAATPG